MCVRRSLSLSLSRSLALCCRHTDARKRGKAKATSTASERSESLSSSALEARGGGDSGVCTSTLKRAAAAEAAGASSASAPMPKRQMPTKQGTGLVPVPEPPILERWTGRRLVSGGMPPPRSESVPQSKTRMHARTEHIEIACSLTERWHDIASCPLMHRCCSLLILGHAVFQAAVNILAHTGRENARLGIKETSSSCLRPHAVLAQGHMQ